MMPGLITIAQGDGSRIVESRRAIVRNHDDWRALWAAHAGPDAQEPSVDFSAQIVAAVFAGERPTPGFAISITAGPADGRLLSLLVAETSPLPGRIAAQMIVTPFHIVAVRRALGDVCFADDPPVASAFPLRSESALRDPSASSTGLDPNTAAALAYLAGPLTGVLILLAERSSRYVKFHAWQAIIGLGGLGALAAFLLVGAFVALVASPVAFMLMYRLAALTAAVWIVVLIVCIVQAARGREWKLPVVGKLAERKASKLA